MLISNLFLINFITAYQQTIKNISSFSRKKIKLEKRIYFEAQKVEYSHPKYY